MTEERADKKEKKSIKKRPWWKRALRILGWITLVLLLLLFVTALEIITSSATFPGQLHISQLLLMNLGLFCLHLFIAGICFFCSCLFNDTKYSLGFGAGIPTLMFILQMLSNTGSKVSSLRYVSFFTLYRPEKLQMFSLDAIMGIAILLVGAIILFFSSILVFSKKDLHI